MAPQSVSYTKAVKLDGNTWQVTVQEDSETKELFVELPPELLSQMGWVEDDVLEWIDQKDGSFILEKVDKE